MVMFMEFSFDVFTYVSLFSMFVVAMTCYVKRQANYPVTIQRFVTYDMNGCKKMSDAYTYTPLHILNDIYFNAFISICHNNRSSDTNENHVIHYACDDFYRGKFCPFRFIAILGRWWMFFDYSVARDACAMEEASSRNCQITCSLAEQVSFRQGVKK